MPYRSFMNNLTTLTFLLVFGLVCVTCGVLIERNRNLRSGRDEWQEGFDRGAERTTKHLFRAAVRATAVQGGYSSSAQTRPPVHVRAWAAVAKHNKLPEGTAVDLNDADTVVLQFPQRSTTGVA